MKISAFFCYYILDMLFKLSLYLIKFLHSASIWISYASSYFRWANSGCTVLLFQVFVARLDFALRLGNRHNLSLELAHENKGSLLPCEDML